MTKKIAYPLLVLAVALLLFFAWPRPKTWHLSIDGKPCGTSTDPEHLSCPSPSDKKWHRYSATTSAR